MIIKTSNYMSLELAIYFFKNNVVSENILQKTSIFYNKEWNKYILSNKKIKDSIPTYDLNNLEVLKELFDEVVSYHSKKYWKITDKLDTIIPAYLKDWIKWIENELFLIVSNNATDL